MFLKPLGTGVLHQAIKFGPGCIYTAWVIQDFGVDSRGCSEKICHLLNPLLCSVYLSLHLAFVFSRRLAELLTVFGLFPLVLFFFVFKDIVAFADNVVNALQSAFCY